MPNSPTDYDAFDNGGEPLTTSATLAALLTDAARFIEANGLGDDVLSLTYAKQYGNDAPTVRLILRTATWSTLCAGLDVTWDANAIDATCTAALPDLPGLRLVSSWQRRELEAAAPDIAARVFPARLTVTGGTWPGGVRS